MAGQDGEPLVRVHRRSERESAEEKGDLPAVVRELSRAKDRLARELDENLKQLKEVLKESQRIARELELVLKEAQSPTAMAVPAAQLRRWGEGNFSGLPQTVMEPQRRMKAEEGDNREEEGREQGVPEWFRGHAEERKGERPH